MAERRMFAKSIVTSDLFLDMPMSARCLYFTFGMFADDDGFINSPKSIMRQIGASVDDFNILLAKKYIICFDSGVIVIKHWKVNNYLQKDRYRPTVCIAECNLLEVDENGAYSLRNGQCIQNVYKMYTQDRIGKVSIGKDSIKSMHACKEKNNHEARARTYACEDYKDIMDDMSLEEEVKPMLWSFIKHCQVNGKKLTNDKLVNILFEMDKQRLSAQEKIDALQAAINGGYFDIKR